MHFALLTEAGRRGGGGLIKLFHGIFFFIYNCKTYITYNNYNSYNTNVTYNTGVTYNINVIYNTNFTNNTNLSHQTNISYNNYKTTYSTLHF